MSSDPDKQLEKGVQNLLINCGACAAGDSVLIVHETEDDGFYDPGLAGAVAEAAKQLGLKVQMHGVPFQPMVSDPDEDLSALMKPVDRTVFFARLGDQIRFRTQDAAKSQIISYALDRGMLRSPFGTTPYDAFVKLKQLVDDAVFGASEIHVTCPEGTDFRGNTSGNTGANADVTRKRFPLSIFTPVPARAFKGTIAQRGFLTGTGSNYYDPFTRGLEDLLRITFDGNQITDFDGTPADVKAARDHYAYVGETFGIESLFVHSWHAGIHPGCEYAPSAADNFERWSGGAFGNPRLLHFHTCGDYPPGEICLNVLDPTIVLDGIAVWENGVLHPERIPGGASLLDANPEMRSLFEKPSWSAGQGPDGRLSFH